MSSNFGIFIGLDQNCFLESWSRGIAHQAGGVWWYLGVSVVVSRFAGMVCRRWTLDVLVLSPCLCPRVGVSVWCGGSDVVVMVVG